MKKSIAFILLCAMGPAALAMVPSLLIDDFEDGNIVEYTSTVILDANGGASNTAAWQIVDGTLQLNTTSYDGIEQYAMIYSGLALEVGQELQVDILTDTAGSQDIGLYVGGTAPQTGVRQDYIAMYRRNTGQLFSRGFNGSTEYDLIGDWTENIPIDMLFIARTAVNTYEAGWYFEGTRNVLATRTPTTPNDADVVGFYADVRGTGVVGRLDNLKITSPLWGPHNPSPAVNSPAAGTALGDGTVDLTLGWSAGLDPEDENQVNPIVTKHYVFVSNDPDDPNLYYQAALPQTGDLSLSFPLTGLTEVTNYRWSVAEAITGYDQQVLTAGVSTLEAVEPNNIFGPVWTFKTAVGVDRRLVAEYLFENNLEDNTLEGNHGNEADPNKPTFDNIDGIDGSYAVFNGINNYVDFGTGAYPKAGDFPYGVGGGLEEGTLTCWVKPVQFGGLLSNYNDGTTTGFALSLADNNGQAETRMNARGESGDIATVQGRPGRTDWDMLGDGQWHMVAAVWKWGEEMTVYVDGGPVASVAAGSPDEFADWQRGVLFGATRNATDRTVLQNFYGGLADTLRVYNYMLTPEEIASEYYAASGRMACTDPSFAGSEVNFDNSGSSYCRIDLADLAAFARAWLSDGLY